MVIMHHVMALIAEIQGTAGYLEFGQKKHSSFLVRSISGSRICRGDALTSQVDKEALVSVGRHSISLSENRIVKAAMMQKQMSNLEEELRNTKARLAEKDASFEILKKRISELEDELEKTKQSESQMLESLMFQTRQIEQTKMDLEESKLDVMTLQEKLNKLQQGGRNGLSNNMDSSSLTIKALKDEVTKLRNQVKVANEANEKVRLSEEQVNHLKKEIERLHEELEVKTETYERLRVESEEHVLAWTSKEMGFITCIKKADEEIASLKHENHRLNEALYAAENTTRISREEGFKLRDILKQALNESSVAKEAANIARAENSELKDLLAEKEESVHFLTKENERLRINEVAARENVKEFKRLHAAKAEANKFYEEHTEVFNSPDSDLYEDHLDGRMTPRQMFNFEFDEFKAFNKDEEDMIFYHEDDNMAEIHLDDADPEKAEALKGSIFDTSASPKSEPQTPKSAKVQHRRSATGFDESSDLGEFEEVVTSVHGGISTHHHHQHHHHGEDGDDKGSYMYGLYNRKKLFRKIGELIVRKNNANNKKEGSIEEGKELAKGQDKEQGKEQGKEPAKEQGKEPTKEKEKGKEHAKEKGKEQGKEQAKEKGKEGKEHTKEKSKGQGKENTKEKSEGQGKEQANEQGKDKDQAKEQGKEQAK
ncbi:uncharacterized protein LOC143535865 [Bidens hawaiensis]|uniref:uncharacterized protein LOC143535865 n=1 Tax=Bidens hawaiensis TaxID=980011 RepID=UPI00404AED91